MQRLESIKNPYWVVIRLLARLFNLNKILCVTDYLRQWGRPVRRQEMLMERRDRFCRQTCRHLTGRLTDSSDAGGQYARGVTFAGTNLSFWLKPAPVVSPC